MVRAVFNGEVIAESSETIEVEGKVYFPPNSISPKYLKRTDHTTYCTYKGDATYYNVNIGGKLAENAVWAYKDPKEGYKNIKDYGSFWNGVTIEKD